MAVCGAVARDGRLTSAHEVNVSCRGVEAWPLFPDSPGFARPHAGTDQSPKFGRHFFKEKPPRQRQRGLFVARGS